MIGTILAIVGTLAGVLLSNVMSTRAARAVRQEEQDTNRRKVQVEAVTALESALADHRRAMWFREDLRLSGADADAIAAARAESHRTRSAITAPLTTARVLVPELGHEMRAAVQATYALRAAADAESLEESRVRAKKASEAFVSAAISLLNS